MLTSRRMRALLLCVVLTGFSFSGMALPLSVTVTNRRLNIEGVTPGSSVALLSVAHEPAYYMTRVVSRRELLSDDDGDGRIQYEPPNGVAFRSIWIVADLVTGEVTIASPPGFKPLQMRQKGAGRGNAVESVANTLDVGRDHVDILVVRPGKGAWAIGVREGRTEDRDGVANGRIRVDLAKLQPLLADFGAAPHGLQPGDVVAILDAERMEYWMMKSEPGGD